MPDLQFQVSAPKRGVAANRCRLGRATLSCAGDTVDLKWEDDKLQHDDSVHL